MTRWLALLRGVNLGKHNKVPMAELRSALSTAGFANVRTYIQSGNVFVDSPERDRTIIANQLSALILNQFSVTSPAIMVSREELAAAIEQNPFATPDADAKAHRIMFLADTPTEEQLATLNPDHSPGNRYVVSGRMIWLDIPQFQTTKLTNDYFDRRLKTVSTLRNRSTCEALLAMWDAD
jgi:uncharacterized protein (DUF1697 family)